MWQHVGIARHQAGLSYAQDEIHRLQNLSQENQWHHHIPHGIQLRNMLITSQLICHAALKREESRGAHFRTDFPQAQTNPVHSLQACTVNTKAYASV